MNDMVSHQHEDCSECLNEWIRWAKEQVKDPIKGFDDKKNADGTEFSLSQQQDATHTQIDLIICDLCNRKKSSSNIHSIISASAVR